MRTGRERQREREKRGIDTCPNGQGLQSRSVTWCSNIRLLFENVRSTNPQLLLKFRGVHLSHTTTPCLDFNLLSASC